MPLWLEIALDPVAVAFVVGLTCVATLFAGIVPALRASRTDVNEILNDESRGSSGVRLRRISHGLVVAEIAVSCALLVVSGLMIRTVTNVSQFDYGFDTDRLFTSRLRLLDGDYPTAQDKRRFGDDLLRRLEDHPGVRSASLTSHLPASGGLRQQLSVGGVAYPTELDHPQVHRVVVSPGYFDTLEVGAVRGRVFARTDTPETATVAIVSEQFVTLYLDTGDPIGQQIKLGDDDEAWRTVVGVVPDLHIGGIGAGGGVPQHDAVYLPLTQESLSYVYVFLRTAQNPMTLTSAVQASIRAIDPRLPIYWVRSMNEQFAMNAVFFEIFGTLFTAFGVAALLLANDRSVWGDVVLGQQPHAGNRCPDGARRSYKERAGVDPQTRCAPSGHRSARGPGSRGAAVAGAASDLLRCQPVGEHGRGCDGRRCVEPGGSHRLLCSRTARGPGQPGRSASV